MTTKRHRRTIVNIGAPPVDLTELRTVLHLQRSFQMRRIAAARARKQAAVRRRAQAATTMQRYARGKHSRTLRTCPICAEDMPSAAFVAVAADCRDAGHRICRPCASKYIDTAVSDGKLYIRCPGDGCRHLAKPSNIASLASTRTRALHRQALAANHAQRLLHEDDDAFLAFARQHTRICPACSVLIYRFEGCNHMSCKCGFEFDWNADDAQISSRARRVPPSLGSRALDAAHGALRLEAGEAFDHSNDSHVATLEALWEAAFDLRRPRDQLAQGAVSPVPPHQAQESHPRSRRWQALGFQGDDPTTDLRAAGVMGLRHLLQYVRSERPPLVSKGQEGLASFPIALASINCTALLQGYLGLNPAVVLPGGKLTEATAFVTPAPAPRLHALLQLLVSDPAALHTLHTRWLRHLEGLWRASRTPTTTIMHFPPVLRTAFDHMTLALQQIELERDLAEVVASFDEHLELQLARLQRRSPTTHETDETDEQREQQASVDESNASPAETLTGEHRLLAMGFSRAAAAQALNLSGGDVQAAVALIVER